MRCTENMVETVMTQVPQAAFSQSVMQDQQSSSLLATKCPTFCAVSHQHLYLSSSHVQHCHVDQLQVLVSHLASRCDVNLVTISHR